MDEIFTVNEFAQYLKMSRSSVYRLIEEEKLPFAIRVNGKWRFKKKDVEQWLEKNKTGS